MHSLSRDNFPSWDEFKIFLDDNKDLHHHNDIIRSLKELIQKNEKIDAAFLTGSLSKGKGDIFSDIDITIMIGDNIDASDVKNYIMERISSIGDFIHVFRSQARSRDLILYFKPFIKLDLEIRKYKQVEKNYKIGHIGSILFDRKDLGKKAKEKANLIEFSIQNHLLEIKDAALAIPTFWYLVAAYLSRGENVTAMDFISWIRMYYMKICGYVLGMRDEGTRRAEKRYPHEIIEYYFHSCARTPDQIWDGIYELIRWYSEWLSPRLAEIGINHYQEKEIEVLKNAIESIPKNGDKHSLF